MNDFEVENHGSICLLKILTVAGKTWVQQHLAEDAQRWHGAVVVEPRFIDDLVRNIEADGLNVG